MEPQALSFAARRDSSTILSCLTFSVAAELRVCGEGKNIFFALTHFFLPVTITISMGMWSQAHTAGEVMIVGVGGFLPFHPEIIIGSIVEPFIVPSSIGKAIPTLAP